MWLRDSSSEPCFGSMVSPMHQWRRFCPNEDCSGQTWRGEGDMMNAGNPTQRPWVLQWLLVACIRIRKIKQMYVIEPRSQVGPREGVKHINIDVCAFFDIGINCKSHQSKCMIKRIETNSHSVFAFRIFLQSTEKAIKNWTKSVKAHFRKQLRQRFNGLISSARPPWRWRFVQPCPTTLKNRPLWKFPLRRVGHLPWSCWIFSNRPLNCAKGMLGMWEIMYCLCVLYAVHKTNPKRSFKT